MRQYGSKTWPDIEYPQGKAIEGKGGLTLVRETWMLQAEVTAGVALSLCQHSQDHACHTSGPALLPAGLNSTLVAT
jgi:hypothetical protein